MIGSAVYPTLAGLDWADSGHARNRCGHHPYFHPAHNHNHSRFRDPRVVNQSMGPGSRHLGRTKSVVAKEMNKCL
jgi:hypothetical protein